MAWWKILLIVLTVFVVGTAGIAWYIFNYRIDIYMPIYADHCASCHGSNLEGTNRGVALINRALTNGDTTADIIHSIRHAHPQLGEPAFMQTLADVEVKGLAIYVGEKRIGQTFTDFQFDRDIRVPSSVQTTDAHDFTMEVFADGLDPLIFSIEPLPNGSWLVTEKERGLSIITPDGKRSEPITGTPTLGSSVDILGIQYGSGWLLDVAIHPQYSDNGWIYLHYTDLCGERCDEDNASASMNRLDRGRIVDHQWVDVETIWQAPIEFYLDSPDTGAGGRLVFDDSGHVFLAAGIKTLSEGPEGDISAQDLAYPYGKIHRVRDDGQVPIDNPFAISTGAAAANNAFHVQTIWTYGHRSPQGLEWHPTRKRVWNSEMGPRGGDELNELIPGHNYGWPFHSQGLEYTGEYVARHRSKNIEFDTSSVTQSLVDITPSPAISSFVFYSGSQFPRWQHDVLIGSLKGSDLFRMVFDGDQLVHQETLITDIGRIRDIEVGFDGLVYLLIETESGSAIVRMLPAPSDA